MQDKIIKMFDRLCKPHGKYATDLLNESLKIKELMSVLNEFGVDSEYIEGVGLIVNKQDNPDKVIVSHMDLIPKFHKGFGLNQKYIIKKNTIVGALDNTITNAVLILIIERMKNDIQGIEFLFSEAEEIGFFGVREYLDLYTDRLKDTFFLNLDVTSEGYNKSCASIEYDCCSFDNLKVMQKMDLDFFYTFDREGDDMSAIKSKGFHGLSYCLPTKDYIHSYDNKARLDTLAPYLTGLEDLIKNKDLKKREKDIHCNYDFKKALKVDSIKDIDSSFNRNSLYSTFNVPFDQLNTQEDPRYKTDKEEYVEVLLMEVDRCLTSNLNKIGFSSDRFSELSRPIYAILEDMFLSDKENDHFISFKTFENIGLKKTEIGNIKCMLDLLTKEGYLLSFQNDIYTKKI